MPDIWTTPNLGLKQMDRNYPAWDDELRFNNDVVDAAVGKVTDIGNYNISTRPSIAAMIGSAVLNKTLIQAILDDEAQIALNTADIVDLQQSITPVGLNDFDSNTVKLNSAVSLSEAINFLDALYFETLNPSAAGVAATMPYTIVAPGADLIEIAVTAGTGTPVGIGTIRWHPARSSFGVQFFGQTAEGNELYVTVGNEGQWVTLTGHDGIGSIQIKIKAGAYATLTGLPETSQTFSMSSNKVDLTENVLTYNGDVCCVIYDVALDQWHFAFTDPAVYNLPILTVTNGGGTGGGARVETNFGGGFSNGVQVYYLNLNAQDTTALAFLGGMKTLLLNWAIFPVGKLSSGVFTNGATSVVEAIEIIDNQGVTGGPWTLARQQVVAADVTLNFGAATGQFIKWDNANTRFRISGAARVEGAIIGTSTLTVANNITTLTGDLLAPAGAVTALGNISTTTGDIIATVGNISIGGNITLTTPGATVDGVDLTVVSTVLSDSYVTRLNTTPKIGTKNESWAIGYLSAASAIELIAGIDPPTWSMTQQPKIRWYGPQLRWEFSDDGVTFNPFGGGGASNLSTVLGIGNNAGAYDIDMNGTGFVPRGIINCSYINPPSPLTIGSTKPIPVVVDTDLGQLYGTSGPGALGLYFDFVNERINMTKGAVTNVVATIAPTFTDPPTLVYSGGNYVLTGCPLTFNGDDYTYNFFGPPVMPPCVVVIASLISGPVAVGVAPTPVPVLDGLQDLDLVLAKNLDLVNFGSSGLVNISWLIPTNMVGVFSTMIKGWSEEIIIFSKVFSKPLIPVTPANDYTWNPAALTIPYALPASTSFKRISMKELEVGYDLVDSAGTVYGSYLFSPGSGSDMPLLTSFGREGSSGMLYLHSGGVGPYRYLMSQIGLYNATPAYTLEFGTFVSDAKPAVLRLWSTIGTPLLTLVTDPDPGEGMLNVSAGDMTFRDQNANGGNPVTLSDLMSAVHITVDNITANAIVDTYTYDGTSNGLIYQYTILRKDSPNVAVETGQVMVTFLSGIEIIPDTLVDYTVITSPRAGSGAMLNASLEAHKNPGTGAIELSIVGIVGFPEEYLFKAVRTKI